MNNTTAIAIGAAGAAAALTAICAMVMDRNSKPVVSQAELLYASKLMELQGTSAGKPKPAKVIDDEAVSDSCRGFSMEEARGHCDREAAEAKKKTPTEVLESLQKGNTRFWMGTATRPELSAFERRALLAKQYPSAAILGCSDSRVPIEIVFDQGLGDLFVIRVAGNCLGTTTTASLEYAAHHLEVKVLVVMGHEGCGAVKAARLPTEKIEQESKNLSDCLKMIKSGLNEDSLAHIHDSRAADREAIVSNVHKQVKALMKDEAIMKKVRSGELIIVGAIYEMSSGIVDFFDKVSAETEVEEDYSQKPKVERYKTTARA